MEALFITAAQIKQSAAQIRQENQQLHTCLQDIYQCMNQITTEWQSPAAETIRTKFQGMLPIFDTYRETIESYALFLDQTIESYQSIEGQLHTHAEAFK